MSVSITMQKYLAEAYDLALDQHDEAYISTSTLAEVLDVSAPAVTRMVSRLRKTGCIEHEPYCGIRLTMLGEQEALKALRRQRIAEVFLVQIVGLGWHEVREEADRLEPVISDSLLARMEVLTAFPRRCPHGEPIPDASGMMPQIDDVPLSLVEPPAELVISRVRARDADMLIYLGDLRLVPEQRITLLSRGAFDGPLHLRVGDKEQVIGLELAGRLRVSHA